MKCSMSVIVEPEKENTVTFALLDINQPFSPLTIKPPATTIINGLSALSLVTFSAFRIILVGVKIKETTY